MSFDDTCPRCHAFPETVMHVLRDYNEVHNFWTKHFNQRFWSKFFSLGEHAWLDWNLSTENVGVSIGALWRDRNSLVFSQSSSMGEDLWASIRSQVHFIENTLVNLLISCSILHDSASPSSWSKPP